MHAGCVYCSWFVSVFVYVRYILAEIEGIDVSGVKCRLLVTLYRIMSQLSVFLAMSRIISNHDIDSFVCQDALWLRGSWMRYVELKAYQWRDGDWRCAIGLFTALKQAHLGSFDASAAPQACPFLHTNHKGTLQAACGIQSYTPEN